MIEDEQKKSADGKSNQPGVFERIAGGYAAFKESLSSAFTDKGKAPERSASEAEEEIEEESEEEANAQAYASAAGNGGSPDASYAPAQTGLSDTMAAQEAAMQAAAQQDAPIQPGEVQGPVQQSRDQQTDTQKTDTEKTGNSLAKYANYAAYNPEMTDEEALALYNSGAMLDDRNYEQIKWFVENRNARGLSNGVMGSMYGDLGRDEQGRRNIINTYDYYGNSLAAAAMSSANLPDDMATMSALELGRIVSEIDSIVADPGNAITVPKGQNMYEYVLSLPQYEGLAKRVEQVSGALALVNEAQAEQEQREKEARERLLESDKAQILAGNGTPEMAGRVADAYANDYVDTSDDELLAIYRAQMRETGTYYSDGGTFWNGGSAAAVEGANMRKLGSGYGLFKSGLKDKTLRVLDEYASAAAKLGMDLEGYLGNAGIDSLDQVIDIAYNEMLAEGKIYAADAEAQQAAEQLATTSLGMAGALATGARQGAESYASDFMQTVYMAVSALDYEQSKLAIQDRYNEQYGTRMAAAMYYADLMAYIDSGALSEESANDLLDHMKRARSIFDVAYEIDASFLTGLVRTGREELQKDVEELGDVIAQLPDDERAAANFASGVTYSLPGMAVATMTGGATGSALIGSAVAWGMPEYSSAYDENRAAGMSPSMASWAAMGNGIISTLVNMGGTGTQMELLWGDAPYAAFREALVSKGGRGLMKEMAKYLGRRGIEEGTEELVEFGLGTAYDLLDKEFIDIEKSGKLSLSRTLDNFISGLYETDYAALAKEAVQNFGAGFVMGGLFSVVGAAKTAYSAVKGARMQGNYASVNLAVQMAEGNAPFTEENIGKVISSLQTDLEDPRFRRWMDSRSAAARDQNAILTAMMLGEGSDARRNAVESAKKARAYAEKERAAQEASASAKSRYFEVRERVLSGEVEADVELENALDQWGKAETALQEATGAKDKAFEKAKQQAMEWLRACRESAVAVKAGELERHAQRIANERLELAKTLSVQYEEEAKKSPANLSQSQEVTQTPHATSGLKLTPENENASPAADSVAQENRVVNVDSGVDMISPDGPGEMRTSSVQMKDEQDEKLRRRIEADNRRRESVNALINPIDMNAIPIEENVKSVSEMEPVSILQGNEFSMSSGTVLNQVREFFNKIGSSVRNNVLGDVQLVGRGVKDSIGHGLGPEKTIAFAAVPDVIAYGKIVNAKRNWKGRGWDTYMIAAPIKIEKGEYAGDYLCGVIVKRASGSQRYYLHEVVLTDYGKNKEGASLPFSPGSLTSQQELSGDNETPSVNSILEGILDVKRRNAKSSNSENAAPKVDALMPGETPATRFEAAQQSEKKNKKLERSAMDAIKALARELKIGLRTRSGQHFQIAGTYQPEGVAGYYIRGQRNAILKPKHAGEVSVAAHEIGHGLQEQLGLPANQQMLDSWKYTFGNSGAYSPEEHNFEAFAEFFWRYLCDREWGVEYAGSDFVDSFETAMRRKKIDGAVEKAQRAVNAYMNADMMDKIGANITNAADAKTKSDTPIARRIEIAMADDTAAAENVGDIIRNITGEKHLPLEQNLRSVVLFNRRSAARANECLTSAMVDKNGNVVGESLKDAFSELNGKEDFDLFWEYMVLKHSMDRDAAKGSTNQVLAESEFSTEERRKKAKQIEQEHPEFVSVNKRFQKWRRLFLETYLADNGFLGTKEDAAAFLDTLDATYQNYVPTRRVKDGKEIQSAEGRTFEIMTATGSTEAIIHPFDTFVGMVNSITTMVADNENKKAFARMFDAYRGVRDGQTGAGFGLLAAEHTQDIERVSVPIDGTRYRVQNLLREIGTDQDAILKVGEIIGDEAVMYRGTGKVDMDNVITVRMEDGKKRYFEIYNPELFALLSATGTMDSSAARQMFTNLTRTMSMLTTGSNPVFALTNAMRDFQNSVNYGSWATSYLDGAVKWLGALADVIRHGEASKEYDALGGGGWQMFDTATKKGAEQVRGEVFKGYNKSSAGRRAKTAVRTAFSIATMEKVNEVIEKTSRLAEYKYGKHDRSTSTGRIEAFLAAQDVTVDFSRHGNSSLTRDLKAVIPFFNASMQGIYRTARQATAQESDRAMTRFAKLVVNGALACALANGILLKYMDEDEKEEYANMSDDLKAKHIFIPNFAPDIFGNAPLIRIPLDQNPAMYAINGAVSNAIWHGQTDNELVIETAALANVILDNLNPVSGSIFDPAIATMTNKNWYGSNIVPTYLQSYDETNQYTEETPTAFVAVSAELSKAGIKISPMMLQYMMQQYTGYIGQTVIPALPSEKNKDNLLSGALNALVATVRKRMTSDPLVSNGVVSQVYDSYNTLSEVYKAGTSKRNFVVPHISEGLSEREKRRAINEADDLIHSGGEVYEAKKEISALYDKIDQINARDDLTDDEKYALTSRTRRKIIDYALDANEAVNDYMTRYVDNGIVKRMIDMIFGGGYDE
ncbi:MAG: LPD38 domain-containing protein [Aristaeellaceae bacterium]